MCLALYTVVATWWPRPGTMTCRCWLPVSDFVSGFTEHTLSFLGSLVSPWSYCGHTYLAQLLLDWINSSVFEGRSFFFSPPWTFKMSKILSCLSLFLILFLFLFFLHSHFYLLFNFSTSSFIHSSCSPTRLQLPDSSPHDQRLPRSMAHMQIDLSWHAAAFSFL